MSALGIATALAAIAAVDPTPPPRGLTKIERALLWGLANGYCIDGNKAPVQAVIRRLQQRGYLIGLSVTDKGRKALEAK